VEFNERLEKKLERARLSKASFMNDTKWTKLFQAIHDSDITLHGERIKPITGEVTSFDLKNHGLSYAKGYTKDAHGGPCAYKDIEWIFIPAIHTIERNARGERLSPKLQANDIHALKELIDALGKFEYDFDEDGMKIYGYK